VSFKRNIYPALVQDSQNPKIIILMGARQVGKTYLMKKLANELKNYRYFNLEFSEQLLLFNGSENEIIQLLKSSGQYIFIDEFHYLENISKIFKAISSKFVLLENNSLNSFEEE
jgi:predicted AAA+ superfamily ATPase